MMVGRARPHWIRISRPWTPRYVQLAELLLISAAEDVGAGDYDNIGSCHDPKGVIADYPDFDEDPHNRSYSQQES